MVEFQPPLSGGKSCNVQAAAESVSLRAGEIDNVEYLSHSVEDSSIAKGVGAVNHAPDVPLGRPSQRDESLDFGSKKRAVVLDSVEKRFDAIAIASRYEDLFLLVIEAKRELSTQMR